MRKTQRGPSGEPDDPRCNVVAGDVLLPHAVARAVPAALRGLASGFGMGPGVSLSLWPPKLYGDIRSAPSPPPRLLLGVVRGPHLEKPHSGRVAFLWQILGLLVPVSSKHYCSSTSGLSTRWSSRGPYSIKDGSPNLETGFPLRCFQRLSLPNVANQQCPW